MSRIDVRIAGKNITVPVYRTTEHTKALAARLNERIKEIEAESDRIDTQAFALQAALSFAAEAVAMEQDHEAEQAELHNDLDELGRRLENLAKQYRIVS